LEKRRQPGKKVGTPPDTHPPGGERKLNVETNRTCEKREPETVVSGYGRSHMEKREVGSIQPIQKGKARTRNRKK